MSQHNTGYVIPYHGTCMSQHDVCHYHDIPKYPVTSHFDPQETLHINVSAMCD